MFLCAKKKQTEVSVGSRVLVFHKYVLWLVVTESHRKYQKKDKFTITLIQPHSHPV